MRRSRPLVLATSVLLGMAVGWLAAQGRQARHRADLFSPRPVRRFAALGFLAGRPSLETLSLLRDYLAWEPLPLLRRRATALAQRLEARLG